MVQFKVDLSDQTFGRWKVLAYSHHVRTQAYWLCRCDCGTERAVNGPELKRGGSTSCGCFQRENVAEYAAQHGMSGHPAYDSWKYARGRCRNPKADGYDLYGGRGIKFSPEWDEFAAFWRDMGPTWSQGLSIDRIDVDGNYEPGNCRWASSLQQANNRRTNRLVQTDIGPLTVTEAARYYGCSPRTLFSRLRYGHSDADLAKPVDIRKRHKPSED